MPLENDQFPKSSYYECEVLADHPDFNGHFPGQAIFPAVSQISLVLDALTAKLASRINLISLSKVKFKAMIKPNTKVIIILEETGDSQIKWQLSDRIQVCSRGIMNFELKS